MSNLISNIDELIDLCHKKIDLLVELQKTLLLADLLGVAAKDLKQPVRHSVRPGQSFIRPWQGAVLSVRIGDGPYEDFPLKEVDLRLWPDDLRKSYMRFKQSKENRLKTEKGNK